MADSDLFICLDVPYFAHLHSKYLTHVLAGYSVHVMNAKNDREEQLTLELLDVIGKKSNVSQRHLARHMGVALGLTNSYLKRCIRKGFIKISEIPANRYLYYLTPKGFTEKSRLTAKYLAVSFSFYRKASDSCAKLFQLCEANDWRKIVLCGISDLAEIAILRSIESDIDIVAVFDPDVDQKTFVGKPVWAQLDSEAAYDACVVTDLNAPSARVESLLAYVDKERILVPEILRLE